MVAKAENPTCPQKFQHIKRVPQLRDFLMSYFTLYRSKISAGDMFFKINGV